MEEDWGLEESKMAKEEWILGASGLEGLGWGSGSMRLCQVGSGVLNNLMWKGRSVWPTFIYCHAVSLKPHGPVCLC